MIRVGVIGLGMMGSTHLDVYARRDDVEVVAVSDLIPDRLYGREVAAGNVEGQAQGGFDFDKVRKYDEGKKLLRDKSIGLIDLCVTTPDHLDFGRRVLRSGRHLMLEKPVARTARDARKLAQVDAETEGFAMIGMCMRFWPGWDWVKAAIDDQRFGRVRAAQFRRVTSHPGGPFYANGDACGGALLDLHVHDTDFVKYCFGMPEAVASVGYSHVTDKVDHVFTRYDYPDGPVVTAEGGWAMSPGFGFEMQFAVNFERATAKFDSANASPLTLFEPGHDGRAVELVPGMGYEHEIGYFLDCIKRGQAPTRVTVADAAETMKIAEAEERSVARAGRPVKV